MRAPGGNRTRVSAMARRRVTATPRALGTRVQKVGFRAVRVWRVPPVYLRSENLPADRLEQAGLSGSDSLHGKQIGRHPAGGSQATSRSEVLSICGTDDGPSGASTTTASYPLADVDVPGAYLR